MTDRWLVEISGLTLGPLDRADVEQMIDSGEVRLDDRVCAEGSDLWQRASDVFTDEDEVFLAAPEPVSQSRTHSAATTSVSTDVLPPAREMPPPVIEEPQPVEQPVAEPYFYIQRDGDEVGPLTLSALQEFVDDGLLRPETPIRGEDDAEWTTAEDYGFEFPEPEVDESQTESEEQPEAAGATGQRVYGGLLWLVFAPFFFLTSGGRSVSSMSHRQIVVAATIVLLIVYAGYHVARNWSQTALTGTITLDGEPLPDVMIVLNGAATGDSGTGVSNSSGGFRIVTLDGELTPGEYHVTVRRLASADTPDAIPIPERFQVLGRSDVVVEVSESTTSCDITLTTQHRLRRNQGYVGGSSAEASAE